MKESTVAILLVASLFFTLYTGCFQTSTNNFALASEQFGTVVVKEYVYGFPFGYLREQYYSGLSVESQFFDPLSFLVDWVLSFGVALLIVAGYGKYEEAKKVWKGAKKIVEEGDAK